ncbi:MAG: hypothetical protein RJA07_2304 [Bacteroidota bacterium]|jgi:hypothetical protein
MKNKIIRVTVISFFTILGCVRESTQNRSVIKNENSIIQLESTSQKEFKIFWKKFRATIIKNDSTNIISLTQFPLETRGEMDSDSIIKYDKKDFAKVLHAFLYSTSGVIQGSQLDEIIQTENPDNKYVLKDWARVTDFQFRRINGKWRLTFLYLNTRDEELWKR